MSAGSRRAQEMARQQAAAAAKRQREQRLTVVAALVVLVLLVGGGIAFQAWRTGRAPDAAPTSGATSLAPVAIADGKPIVLGRSDAPVKLTLYEDFHCPHCAEFEDAYGPVLTAARDSREGGDRALSMSFIDAGSAPRPTRWRAPPRPASARLLRRSVRQRHTRWSDDQLIALADQVGPGDVTGLQLLRHQPGTRWLGVSINAAAERTG